MLFFSAGWLWLTTAGDLSWLIHSLDSATNTTRKSKELRIDRKNLKKFMYEVLLCHSNDQDETQTITCCWENIDWGGQESSKSRSVMNKKWLEHRCRCSQSIMIYCTSSWALQEWSPRSGCSIFKAKGFGMKALWSNDTQLGFGQ